MKLTVSEGRFISQVVAVIVWLGVFVWEFSYPAAGYWPSFGYASFWAIVFFIVSAVTLALTTK